MVIYRSLGWTVTTRSIRRNNNGCCATILPVLPTVPLLQWVARHYSKNNTTVSTTQTSATLPLKYRRMSTLAAVEETTTTKSVSGSESAPDVVLVWTRKITSTTTNSQITSINEPQCFHVSLQQPTIQETAMNTADILSRATSVLSETTTDPGNDIATGSSKFDGTNDTAMDAPESVLIYERQLRKAQHAKKTSRPISDDDLHVIYVDDYIVVINKPAGILTVPGLNHNPSMLDLVYAKYGTHTVTDPVHMVVHRLDMDTSGLVLFARTLDIAKQMHAMFRDHHISKQYECLVMGHLHIPFTNNNNSLQQTKILIDLPIQRDHEHPPFMRISTPRSEQAAMECVDQLQLHGWKKIIRKAAKPSQSILQIIEHGKGLPYATNNIIIKEQQREQPSLPYTRLRLEPITGRTHQLRVHCAAIGYPIVGDPTYGLYGEAALFGGLDSLLLRMNNNKTDGDDRTTNVLNVTPAIELTTMSRCSIDTMKTWTTKYPPNIEPMCLHAAYLKLTHPVTGKIYEWDVPPTF